MAVHDEHGDARLGGEGGGAELGLHTARTSLGTRASRGGHEGLGQVVHAVNQGGIGVLAGVLVVKAVHVGEVDEDVGVADSGHVGRQDVVAAELGQLVGGDGVILVDDGHTAHGEKGLKGVLGQGAAGGIVQHVTGEEHLGHGVAVEGEELIVEPHELALTDGGHGLLLGDGGGSGGSHLGHACRDRARGDQHDLLARVLEVGQDPHQRPDAADIQCPRGVGQGGGTHLHHDTAAVFQHTHKKIFTFQENLPKSPFQSTSFVL